MRKGRPLPAVARGSFALAYLGMAGFLAWELAAFAGAFRAAVPSLGDRGAAGAVWAVAGLCGLFGLLLLAGKVSEPWASRVSRWALALVFLAAAVPKILDPAGFAADIRNYDLVHRLLLNALAITLPWLEAVCALALLSGLLRPGAVLLVNLLLAVFLAGLIQAWYRGLDINCGCFGHGGAAEPVAKAALRDLFFLGWSLPLLLTERE